MNLTASARSSLARSGMELGSPPSASGNDDTRMFHYALTQNEAEQALALANHVLTEYGNVNSTEFLADVTVIAHDLPLPVRRAANRSRLDERNHVFVIANNVPGYGCEATPRRWAEADTPGSRPYAFLLAIYAALLGDPIGWAAQQGGRIITDVVPVAGLEDSLVSSSSRTELAWHTEDAFSPYRADWVGLLCLRSPAEVPTTLSYISSEVASHDIVAVLRQRRFRIMPDPSHESSASPPIDEPVALLTGSDAAPTLRVDRDFTEALDDQAAEALHWLRNHLDENLYEIALTAGDVGFINNHNAVHGRRPFTPRHDGTDRWLKRVNVAVDIRRSRPARAGSAHRVVH